MDDEHDAALGCGYMILGLIVAAVILWTIFFAALFDLGPFA